MKRILLTGGAGFIGSNLTKKLLSSKLYQITCVDNFDPFYPRSQKEENIKDFILDKNYCFVESDIREKNKLYQIGEIDAIVHLAAKAGVRPSIKDPFLYQDVNVAGTQNLLEFAKNRGIRQFVFASSSSVYGTNPNTPWSEEDKLYPISPYACSKASDEMLGHAYMHLYDIRFIALRLFTVYGPAQRPDLAIHKFFQAITNNMPIEIYGNGYTSRDYTFIDDIIMGIEAAINYQSSSYEIINLGNNSPVRLALLIETIEHICGKKAIIFKKPNQPGDVENTFADITKAKNLLGYTPSTNLESGLCKFYDWFISNKGTIQVN